MMGYRWIREKKGQYADGHERADVTAYRQNVHVRDGQLHEAQVRQMHARKPQSQKDRSSRVAALRHDAHVEKQQQPRNNRRSSETRRR